MKKFLAIAMVSCLLSHILADSAAAVLVSFPPSKYPVSLSQTSVLLQEQAVVAALSEAFRNRHTFNERASIQLVQRTKVLLYAVPAVAALGVGLDWFTRTPSLGLRQATSSGGFGVTFWITWALGGVIAAVISGPWEKKTQTFKEIESEMEKWTIDEFMKRENRANRGRDYWMIASWVEPQWTVDQVLIELHNHHQDELKANYEIRFRQRVLVETAIRHIREKTQVTGIPIGVARLFETYREIFQESDQPELADQVKFVESTRPSTYYLSLVKEGNEQGQEITVLYVLAEAGYESDPPKDKVQQATEDLGPPVAPPAPKSQIQLLPSLENFPTPGSQWLQLYMAALYSHITYLQRTKHILRSHLRGMNPKDIKGSIFHDAFLKTFLTYLGENPNLLMADYTAPLLTFFNARNRNYLHDRKHLLYFPKTATLEETSQLLLALVKSGLDALSVSGSLTERGFILWKLAQILSAELREQPDLFVHAFYPVLPNETPIDRLGIRMDIGKELMTVWNNKGINTVGGLRGLTDRQLMGYFYDAYLRTYSVFPRVGPLPRKRFHALLEFLRDNRVEIRQDPEFILNVSFPTIPNIDATIKNQLLSAGVFDVPALRQKLPDLKLRTKDRLFTSTPAAWGVIEQFLKSLPPDVDQSHVLPFAARNRDQKHDDDLAAANQTLEVASQEFNTAVDAFIKASTLGENSTVYLKAREHLVSATQNRDAAQRHLTQIKESIAKRSSNSAGGGPSGGDLNPGGGRFKPQGPFKIMERFFSPDTENPGTPALKKPVSDSQFRKFREELLEVMSVYSPPHGNLKANKRYDERLARSVDKLNSVGIHKIFTRNKNTNTFYTSSLGHPTTVTRERDGTVLFSVEFKKSEKNYAHQLSINLNDPNALLSLKKISEILFPPRALTRQEVLNTLAQIEREKQNLSKELDQERQKLKSAREELAQEQARASTAQDNLTRVQETVFSLETLLQKDDKQISNLKVQLATLGAPSHEEAKQAIEKLLNRGNEDPHGAVHILQDPYLCEVNGHRRLFWIYNQARDVNVRFATYDSEYTDQKPSWELGSGYLHRNQLSIGALNAHLGYLKIQILAPESPKKSPAAGGGFGQNPGPLMRDKTADIQWAPEWIKRVIIAPLQDRHILNRIFFLNLNGKEAAAESLSQSFRHQHRQWSRARDEAFNDLLKYIRFGLIVGPVLGFVSSAVMTWIISYLIDPTTPKLDLFTSFLVSFGLVSILSFNLFNILPHAWHNYHNPENALMRKGRSNWEILGFRQDYDAAWVKTHRPQRPGEKTPAISTTYQIVRHFPTGKLFFLFKEDVPNDAEMRRPASVRRKSNTPEWIYDLFLVAQDGSVRVLRITRPTPHVPKGVEIGNLLKQEKIEQPRKRTVWINERGVVPISWRKTLADYTSDLITGDELELKPANQDENYLAAQLPTLTRQLSRRGFENVSGKRENQIVFLKRPASSAFPSEKLYDASVIFNPVWALSILVTLTLPLFRPRISSRAVLRSA